MGQHCKSNDHGPVAKSLERSRTNLGVPGSIAALAHSAFEWHSSVQLMCDCFE